MVSHLLKRYRLISIILPIRIYSALECGLYIAESTIPNAGIGIFSGVAKSASLDDIGNGDKAIPLVDLYFHNMNFIDNRIDPTIDYVWQGSDMGMRLETTEEDDISGFSPGVDAMVNCHPGLFNVEKSTTVYDEGEIHRSKHPGAGALSPYTATESEVIRDIPIGGEIFKDYGPQWFIDRPWLGNVPLVTSYEELLDLILLMELLIDNESSIDVPASVVYNELIKEFKIIWDSRTLNGIHDFTWEDFEEAIEVDDVGFLLQRNASRSIEWLNENGKCIDHIVPKRSTINGAG